VGVQLLYGLCGPPRGGGGGGGVKGAGRARGVREDTGVVPQGEIKLGNYPLTTCILF
jgi:hypothetical protein